MSDAKIQIITFYQFKDLQNLESIKKTLKDTMHKLSILGTIIIAEEGFNSTVSGTPESIGKFKSFAEKLFETKLFYKSSFHKQNPFKRIFVKIKPEIVTLKQKVDIKKGIGTHISPKAWNEIIQDKETIVIDTRNDYEFQVGSFKHAINPKTEKFSDLPKFIAENLNPEKHKKVAMFCTGGIRCEKFAPFMKEIGFENIYQLEGGILRYLEEIPETESLWRGECFVFDERVTVDENLQKGNAEDLSVKLKSEKSAR